MKSQGQKFKMLRMVEILRSETDEQHPISTNTLISRLSAEGVNTERRGIYKDISELVKAGYPVVTTTQGKQNAYYMAEDNLTVSELKIILDAVQAASFITPGKTRQLTDKLVQLGGDRKSELLKKNIICFNTRKHTNEAIYDVVETLQEALCAKHRASFCYFDLNEKAERVFRKNHERYVVEPLALIFSEDNYYLMVYNAKYETTNNYRVDRMTEVKMEGEPICDAAAALINQRRLSTYTKAIFKMYNGEERKVILRFPRKLIGVVFDKFGERTKLKEIAPDLFETSVRVQVSPTFKGWVAQFEGEMEVKEDS